MTRPITPLAPQGALYPVDAAWMARTDLKTTRLLGYTDVNIDSVTGIAMGLFGHQPAVRHASMVTTEILDFISRCGIELNEDLRIYRTGDEAVASARALISEGYRLMSPYPLPEGLYPPEASVVPAPLWYRLNAKARLADLVAAQHLAPRQVVTPDTPITAPVFLKVGGAAVTGWAYGVRHCETAAQIEEARAWFRDVDAETDLVAEAALDVVTCWCAHIGCSETQTLYLGAAEQTFSALARQSGSVIDPDMPFPIAGQALVRAAGDKARTLGYRGIAALDVGLTADGRLIAFDPNFRLNASTPQILLHEAATRGTPWRVSQSAAGTSTLPMGEILARLSDPARSGWFVPTRLLDASRLPAAKGASLWTGFVLGADRAEAAARSTSLAAILSDPG